MTALPINVKELLTGQVVEWERLEFKKGWNPEEVIHTICAFANDFHNWGGGYIIIGVEEKDGQPVFPPTGVPASKVDSIQKELINLGYRMRPNYHPIAAPIVWQKKMLLLIWCPGGQTRPYQAPETLTKNAAYSYFIRRNSSTLKAQTKDIQQLHEMANQVPFDDRICHQADLKDLKLSLMKDFLREIESDLALEADKISFPELCRQMQIAQGPDEYLKPLNIGLMMFNPHPEQFFPCAQIEVVEFHDEAGDSFSEKIFKGPIHLQLKESLRYLHSMFLKEEVRKRPEQAEADRFYNYPYEALEEALANAVYHKDYSQREPIEVRIHPDRIEILSFPGPLPPLKIEDLNHGTVRVRTYRNRRIGDFLKELHLTEGRCTGIPKIRKAMKNNGSPSPAFETDAAYSYFLTVLPIHPHADRKSKKNGKHTSPPPNTHQSPPKYTPVPPQIHTSPPPNTHQSSPQYTPVPPQESIDLKNIPDELKTLIRELGKKPRVKKLRSVIRKLCAWKSLTAQQLAEILNFKDKKNLVRKHITPMIRSRELKYARPGDKNLPDQSYKA